MNRLLKITVLALFVLVPLLGGCHKASAPADGTAGIPRTVTGTAWPAQGKRPAGILGLGLPVTLTADEKSVIELVAEGASSWYLVEVASYQWYAILWADSAVVTMVWLVDEQTAVRGTPSYVNPNALWYPGITVSHTEGGITYLKQVAVDYDSYRVVFSSGPYIPPGTRLPSN